jgi:hypothetical protein
MKKTTKQIMTFLIILFALFNCSLKLSGQDNLNATFKKNVVSVDLATFKFIGMSSINYERSLFDSKHLKILINTGIGGWYFTTISKWYYGCSIPLSINNLIGKNNNYFEIDIGVRYTSFNKRSEKDLSSLFPILNLGYRYQRPNGKGIIFRSFLGFSGIGLGLGKAF